MFFRLFLQLKILQWTLMRKKKTARVKVPQEELSLAIGKDGQNVRLASKLTGYRIEIEGEAILVAEEAKEEVAPDSVESTDKSKTKPTKKEKAEEIVAETVNDLEEAKIDLDAPVEIKVEESENQPLEPENPETDTKEENANKSS
jgi:N utilization substance protein A